MSRIDAIESRGLQIDLSEIREKTALINKQFPSKVEPVMGIYGTTETVKDGITILRGKNESGYTYREYIRDGKIYQYHELLGNGRNRTTYYDDNGSAYSVIKREHNGPTTRITDYQLLPDREIVKSNFTAQTDHAGRLVSTKLTEVKINTDPKPNTTNYKVDRVYKAGDDVGHGMAHSLGGPTGPENLFAQNSNVNRSAFRRVESEVQSLVEQGKKVDYEVKANYVGSSSRPSSFEPKITVDGVDHPLPDDLKKIYNDTDVSAVKKAVTDVGEMHGLANEVGIKSGLVAAGITLAVSTVDNVSAYVDGEITAEEMIVDIVTETATAGAIEYGAEFISVTASQAMSKSSSALIQKVAGSSMPAAVVSFAVESYDSVSAYAKGEIDCEELAYELGENAASVAGAMKGASIGAAIGSVAGPAGTIAGGLVGGVVGAAVASEVYATAVELGADGVDKLAEHAEGLMKNTIELVEQNIPEKLSEVKSAFNDYIGEFNLPFCL